MRLRVPFSSFWFEALRIVLFAARWSVRPVSAAELSLVPAPWPHAENDCSDEAVFVLRIRGGVGRERVDGCAAEPRQALDARS